ncbi:tigger transposable element-derived protein 1-like [Zootoca vivipara]|uniref:tigger transposable element-derived protein 1-like n=1 Tax=Zootoca vivipara TaxID=8524 RepID=UPI001592ADE6|nr:tigger transposable element-derived protein 1-like [Zootoca vivipara]
MSKEEQVQTDLGDFSTFSLKIFERCSSTVRNMGPKQAAAEKRTKEKITVVMKKEIIRKHDDGMRVTDLAREYGRNTSTIGTILKMREKILAMDAAKGVTRIMPNRPAVLEEVEKLLLIWMKEKQRAGDTVTEAVICEKAKALHADLIQQQAGSSDAEPEVFKASRGWFERFKTRSGVHSVVRHGEAASSDAPAAEKFAPEFLQVVADQGYLPQQVFNCDETGLFWKRMPKRTFLTQEEAKLPGHKPMKDRLTLLFCANASGDLKIKPMLVYQSENPRAFKKHKIDKGKLRVLWRSNSKVWVTCVLFVEWVNLVFDPAVKQYLLDKDLPLKAMLLMDNAPAHPPGLEDELLQDFRFIKSMFLPPNTTPLLQPMDQQVITNFKKLYTRELFRRCFEVTDTTNLTLRDFWKNHFDIAGCVRMIVTAWDRVSQRVLNSAWRKLWPDCVAKIDTGASAPAPETTVLEDIVSLARDIGLEVTVEDVCELLEEHDQDQELSTEELVELQAEATQEETQTPLEEEEAEVEEHVSSTELKDICRQWESVQRFARQHHPDKSLARDLANTFDTRVMSSFRGILKRRQKQQSMDRFVTKKPRVEGEPAAPEASQPETVAACSSAPSTSSAT